MNAKGKFYGSLALLAALLVCCALLQQSISAGSSESSGYAGVVKKTDSDSFTDNSLLYENDTTEVTTIYLTAMTGSSEDTDSSFQDVTQSQNASCEALVQVGDDQGPLAGELGFGRQSANATIRGRKTPGDGFQIRLRQDAGTYNGQQVINLVKSRKHGARFLSELLFHTASGVPSLPSLQTSLVHLYVQDETIDSSPDGFVDYGLYTQIEQLNRTALGNHGLNESGALYEIRDFDFSLNDAIVLESDPNYDEAAFQTYLENKGETDNEALLALLEDIEDESLSPDDFVEKYFDLDNLTSFLAFEMLTGNRNTSTGNFCLYSPLNGETWYFWPTDFDGAFDREEDEVLGKQAKPLRYYGAANYWDNLLFRKCLKSDVCRDAVLEKAESLVSESGALYEGTFAEEVDSLSSVVESYAFGDADRDGMPLTSSQYETLTGKIRTAPSQYLKDLQDSINRPMPFTIAAPEAADDTLTIAYTSSYSFGGEVITYHVQVARTPDMEDPILDTTTQDTSVSLDLPDAGQYFVYVQAEDEDGGAQEAENAYETEDGTVWGVRCFWILKDGTVAGDGT